MKHKIELAVNTFKEGFNCSQAVFSSFCDLFGIEKETAYKISSGLEQELVEDKKYVVLFLEQ